MSRRQGRERRVGGWAGCLLAGLLAAGCGQTKAGPVGADDREAIALIAEGSFATYPDAAIGDAAACYFDSTAWTSLLGVDNYTYVNLEGHGVAGAPTTALLQFRVFRATATFTLSAMELNGIAQPDSVVLQVVDAMFACRAGG